MAVCQSNLFFVCESIAMTTLPSVQNHTIKNPLSARISVPSLFVPSDGKDKAHAYKWRTPLRSTAPYWESMSQRIAPIWSPQLANRSYRRLVPGTVQQVSGCPSCPTSRSCWDRQTGQGTHDRPDAREIPNGSCTGYGAHDT